MTMSRTPVVFALALATFAVSSVSCTAILAPRDDVQRCGTKDDCDPTGDNRYVPACKFDDANIDLDTSEVDKICVADFKPNVGCNPDTYTAPEHPYRVAYDTLAVASRYAVCDPMTQLGTMGCPPANGTCNQGLAVNDAGLCDDDDPGTPMAVAITSETLGQDVRDQFCRSFFCDDRFVCDPATNFCALCDEDEDFGEGGCGEVYIAGARSCVYDDGGACEGADASDDAVTFGACM